MKKKKEGRGQKNPIPQREGASYENIIAAAATLN